MSSTNRSAIRNDKDYYVTPLKTVRTFLDTFTQLEPDFNVARASFLDPCAGGDSYNDMSYPLVLKEMGAQHIETIDIRQDSKANIIGDYLGMDIQKKYDAVFTNPPYAQCLEFIQKALTNVHEGGFVGMIIRLNYYGTVTRRNFWQSTMPKWTIVHSNRPSFSKSSTDSTEYAHMVWQVGRRSRYSNLIVI